MKNTTGVYWQSQWQDTVCYVMSTINDPNQYGTMIIGSTASWQFA
jgi:hypothetical protein